MKKENNQEEKKKPLKNWMYFSGIALQMLIIIGGSIWLGIYIDDNRKAEFPLFTVVFSLLGVFVALIQVITSLKRYLED